MRVLIVAAFASLAWTVPLPALAADCACENIGALQNELKIALTLRDRHVAKAKVLRDKYGDPPKDENIAASRADYFAFENVPADGSPPARGHVGEGLPQATPGAPKAITYTPRGNKMRVAGAANAPGGIDPAVAFTPIGDKVPDLDKRRAIEQSFRDKKQDLCDHEDEAAFKAAMSSGSVCSGVTRAVEAHEATHRQTCRKMGFYAFFDRYPADLADDEARAYQAQIDVLAGDIRRILKQKKTKLLSGSPGATPESLVDVKVRCALAFSVAGQVDDLKFADKVCDSAEAFTVKTSPNANFRFMPSGEKAGTYAYSGRIAGAQFHGSGGYVLELENGKGALNLDGSGRWHVTHPRGKNSKGGPETLRATELPEGCS